MRIYDIKVVKEGIIVLSLACASFLPEKVEHNTLQKRKRLYGKETTTSVLASMYS